MKQGHRCKMRQNEKPSPCVVTKADGTRTIVKPKHTKFHRYSPHREQDNFDSFTLCQGK